MKYLGDLAEQEYHIAWLKLYHQPLWKVSKTIHYQGINDGLCYVKHDKAGDLIKKLIILQFLEFHTVCFKMNMAQFSFSRSVCLSSSCSHRHRRTHIQTHAHIQTHFSYFGRPESILYFSSYSNAPPLWIQCGGGWTFAFIVTIIFKSLLISLFFSVSSPLRTVSFFFQMEKLISVLLWRRQGSSGESCSVLSVETCGKRGATQWQVSHCSFLLSPLMCPHSHLHTHGPHLLWNKTASTWAMKGALYCTWPLSIWHAPSKATSCI